MKNVLTYKEFIGSVHFSAADKVFHGKIEGITDLVTFEGRSVAELTKAFHEAVSDYLTLCKETGKEPERSYKGSFNVRECWTRSGGREIEQSDDKLCQTATSSSIAF